MSQQGSWLLRRRRGAAAVQAAVCLTVLLGVMAIVLDGGVLYAERRHAQDVADAAALAGAADLLQHYWPNAGTDPNGTARASALSTAAANGYSNDGTISTVTVNIPPQSGLFVGQAGYVEVLVQWNQSRSFSGLWGSSSLPVTARAVARGLLAPSSVGLLVLGPSGTTVTLKGNATVNIQNGSVVVDSTGPNVFSFSGNSNNTNITGTEIDLVSSSSNLGASTNYFNGPNGTAATINYNQPSTPDPLANLPVPPIPSSVQSTGNLSINSSTTLSPGLYEGNITIQGNANVTMNPGIYYVQGGFTTGGTGSVTANGVLLYVTGAVNLAGGGGVTWTPMSSGIYSGLSIFQSRTSSGGVTLVGNSGWNLQGTIYAPNAQATLSGTSSSAVEGSQVIASSVSLNGNVAFNVNGSGTKTPTQREFQLVE
jgi:Flp pilus assembly protein TadG